MCSTMVGGGWRLAVGGGWRLAVGNWRLVAVGGGWRWLVVGDRWLVAVHAVRRGPDLECAKTFEMRVLWNGRTSERGESCPRFPLQLAMALRTWYEKVLRGQT